MINGSIYPGGYGSIYPQLQHILKHIHIVLTSVHKIHFASFKTQP